MGKFKIVTVDYNIVDKNISNITMDDDNSLLDGDIVVIDPLIYGINISVEQGKILRSTRVIEIFGHRRKELTTLLDKGKVVIVFFRPISFFKIKVSLRPPYSFKYNNYKNKYAEDYKSISNYEFLPFDLRFFNKYVENYGGKIIKNASKEYLSNIYNEFKDSLEYETHLCNKFEDETYNKQMLFKDFILRNNTDNLVGFAFNISNGKLFFIPYIDIDKYENPKMFIDLIINFCRPLFEKDIKTPEPKWGKNEIYSLPGEKEIINKILELKNEKKTLEEKIEHHISKQEEITDLRKLLYEKGKQLEMVTRKAFEKLGFIVSAYNEGDMEHDIILESEEGRIIGEIEGKDKNMLRIDKLDQLSRVIYEDFKNNQEMANGILIGNAFRHKDPQERGNIFSDKVRKSALRNNIALLSTVELFRAVKTVLSSQGSDSDNEELKRKYREQIFNSMGKEVFFNPNNKDI